MGDIRDDPDFMHRRMAAREALDRLSGATGGDPGDRRSWFDAVYDRAEGDAAAVPWADLAPKQALTDWLAHHPGAGRRAVDIACGLGDNAESIAAAGWATTAFDFAEGAVAWARRRFADSPVDYRVADLFEPPAEWIGAFDLVHECYTLQALSGPMREAAFDAVTDLLAPEGTLLVITRVRDDGTLVDGPPWPLTTSEFSLFEARGLTLVTRLDYDRKLPDGRVIAHARVEYRR